MAIKLLYLGAVGLGAIIVSNADRQGLFAKHGADIRLVPVAGTQIPDLTRDTPVGYIGAPAALMRAAAGVNLKIIASFDDAHLSGCLVVAPSIRRADQLYGKRLGARVIGAAMWLHTITALDKLGLDSAKDNIEIAEIGDPTAVMAALEAGRIDGAVLSRAQCDQLAVKGFTILLDLSTDKIYGAPDALVVAGDFLAGSSKPEAILAAMIESAAFVSSPDHIDAALSAVKTTLGLTDDVAAQRGLRELKAMLARKPYPSADRLRDMQRMMTKARPSVASLIIESVIEDRLVRALDASGYIERTYSAYGLTPR